ncbi:MAG: sialate O-acetylesterase [Opitutus sp.]|nr:sialate O-acetylesterase [Opitutus sp.]
MSRFAAFLLSLVLFTAGCVQAPQPSRPLRVACLGDSITEAGNLGDQTYPAQLGRLLGAGYDVRNFGVSGSTLLDAGDKPYRQQPKFAAALEFQPDIVVIALGTNDSKPFNWRHRENFTANYAAVIAQLRALPSKPRIWICQPMPSWPPSGWAISPEIIEHELHPLIAEIARTEKTGLIDLFTPMRDHHDWVPDHVHPDARGAAVLAETVADAIKSAK